MQSAPALAPQHFGAVGGLMPKGLGRRRARAREVVRSESLRISRGACRLWVA